MHRQKAYRELPIGSMWWLRFEPMLIAGIELRLAGLSVGMPELTGLAKREKNKANILALIAGAERIAEVRGGSADSSGHASDDGRAARSDPPR